jgi:pimeloyl-ACP methyl ester carboxylesterase
MDIGPLHFISIELTAKYLGLCFFASLGTLQLVAARYDFIDLALLDRRAQPLGGYLLGSVLVVGSFSVFFAITPEVFVPGLAGSELFTLFSLGATSSLIITLIGASLLYRPRRTAATVWPVRDHSAPMIAIVPGPSDHIDSLSSLRDALLESGFGLALLSWSDDPASIVSAGLAAFDCSPNGFGLAGIGVGGTLALQAAATAPRVKAVAALDPLDPSDEPGLALLHGMTFNQAWVWKARDRESLLTMATKLNGRSVLLVYHDEVAERTAIPAQTGLSVCHTSADDVSQLLSIWFQEALTR